MRKIGKVEKYNKVSWDKIGRYKSCKCVISLLQDKLITCLWNKKSLLMKVSF